MQIGIGASQLIAVADQGVASRAVDHVLSPNDVFTVSGIERYAVVIEFKRFDRSLFPDVTTGFGCVIEKDFVEFRSQDLIGGWTFRI